MGCATLPAASLLRHVLAGDVESSTCALCLCEESLISSVLPLTLDSGQTITLEKLSYELQFEYVFAKLFPKRICISCVNQMKSFYVFKKKCLRTKTYLQNFINTLENDILVASTLSINVSNHTALHIKSDLKTFNNNLSEETDKPQGSDLILATFACDYCKRSFKKKQNLRKHIATKHSLAINSSDYKYCIEKIKKEIKEITNVSDKREDIKESVQNISDPLSAVDPFGFIQDTEDAQNIKEHNEVFECRKCGANLSSLDELYGHLKVHKSNPYHICRLCGLICKGLPRLLSHRKSVHSKMPPLTPLMFRKYGRLLCCFCKANFDTQFKLKCHIYDQHATRDETECRHCHENFSNHWVLSIHKCPGMLLNVQQGVLKEEHSDQEDSNVGDISDVNEAIENISSISTFKAVKLLENKSDATKSNENNVQQMVLKEEESEQDDNNIEDISDVNPTKESVSFSSSFKAPKIVEIIGNYSPEATHLSLETDKSQNVRETDSSVNKLLTGDNTTELQEENESSKGNNLLLSVNKYNKIIENDKALMASDPSLQATKARIIEEIKKQVQSNLYPDGKKHQCKVCSLVLKSHQSLLDHQLHEHGMTVTKYPCKLCNRTYKTVTALKVHNFTLHTGGKKCELCGTYYTKNHKCRLTCPECTELNCVHRRYLEAFFKAQQEKPLSKHKCIDCSFECSRKINLIKHINRCHLLTSPAKPYSCNICNRSFASEREKTAHTGSHFKKRLRYPCEKCEKLLPSRKESKKHEATHPPDARFLCQGCKQTFGTRGERLECLKTHKDEVSGVCPVCGLMLMKNLQRHLKIHSKILHPKPISEKKSSTVFMCDTCGAMRHSERSLNIHKSRHVSQDKCPICSKFVWKARMKKHLQNHETHPKPKLQCPDCDFSTLSVRPYERHLSGVHSRVKPFRCGVCGKTFCAIETLARHKTLHKGVTVACGVCKKIFRSIVTLRLHKLDHDRQLKFPCQQCGRRFATADVRNEHQVTVHAKPKLECSMCEEIFFTSKDLREHLREYHNVVRRYRTKE